MFVNRKNLPCNEEKGKVINTDYLFNVSDIVLDALQAQLLTSRRIWQVITLKISICELESMYILKQYSLDLNKSPKLMLLKYFECKFLFLSSLLENNF